MDLFEKTKTALFGNKKINNAVFLKEDRSYESHIRDLENLLPRSSGQAKDLIERHLQLLRYGKQGEDAVRFELQNSFIPMMVLHGLHIEYQGLKAQIDYLIVTRKFTLVLECKNLFGNIEVNSSGDFVRVLSYHGQNRKEGIYSPITQLQRHMDLIKQIRREQKNNFLQKAIFDKLFSSNYKSAVVLANPKTVVHMKYAKKEVRDQIIRCDQINARIRELLKKEKDNTDFDDTAMYEHAQFFRSLHRPEESSYFDKYIAPQLRHENLSEQKSPPVQLQSEKVSLRPLENSPLYKELKAFRLAKCRAENIKAYLIYNNAQMEALIEKMPSTLSEMGKLNGFSPEKCRKYGAEILAILEKHR